MSRILITGATGNIGKELVKSLKARGIEFAIMSHRPDARADVPVVHGDFRQPETLAAAFTGVETLFILTPLEPDMLAMTQNAVAAAKAAGIKHIVRSSGAGADPDSPFSIARVHGAADRCVQESGLAWTLVRPNFFMQNHLGYYLEQIRSGAHTVPRGNGAISIIDTHDVADSVAAILANPAAHAGRIYTLTGSEALTSAEQMAVISTAIGHEVRYIDIPDESAIAAMTTMGIPAVVVDWLMSLNAVVKAGYAGGISDDVLKLTGRPPRRFADFVKANASRWLPTN
mgnify:CR=1 FL=1